MRSLHGRGRWGRRERSAIFVFQLLVDAGLGEAEVLFVGVQPSLIGVLEGGREGRHDLAAVAQVATNLGPFLELAYLVKSASGLDGLLQLVEVEGPLVNAGEPIEVGPLLLVELGELVEVCEVRARACEGGFVNLSGAKGEGERSRIGRARPSGVKRTAFHRVQLLLSSSKMEELFT